MKFEYIHGVTTLKQFNKKISLKFQTTALLIIATIPIISQAEKAGNPPTDKAPSVPGELLVQFLPGATTTDKGRALGRIHAEVVDKVVPKSKREDGGGDLVLIRHQPDFTPAAARHEIESDPAIEFAEPNYIYSHQAISNDTYYTNGSLWGMYSTSTNKVSYGSQASTAWANEKYNCGTVYVGIIDEGYMYTHVDLQANAAKNPGEVGIVSGIDISKDGKDNDGNGYIDDVYGWDFDGNNKTVFDGINDDHGTHVAGTIGGVGGNGKGVAGVCWSVKLLNAKFLGNNGGTLANAIKAVDYFTNLKLRTGINLVATNNSWGGGGYSQGLFDAIERANTANILFVAAAGNSSINIDAIPFYPAGYTNSNILAVASITSTGTLSSFSNYGATSADLGAPGSAIYSTVPVRSGINIVSGYGNYSGTSMATPHVTGACALYAASHPGATAGTIKAAILNSVISTSSLSGKTASNGRLDISKF
ncbi:S8 family peptidase [Methylobacter sp.]|uniref:S8 family peptidase n=1 Tax=Methylobacter sp. TaxID=2051955 RepID=UPI001210A39C|nr:S8 family peptidase [Methylobacter sp.]TAK63988.1 MAG: peptidase S8 [Methylobacter sp.]